MREETLGFFEETTSSNIWRGEIAVLGGGSGAAGRRGGGRCLHEHFLRYGGAQPFQVVKRQFELCQRFLHLRKRSAAAQRDHFERDGTAGRRQRTRLCEEGGGLTRSSACTPFTILY